MKPRKLMVTEPPRGARTPTDWRKLMSKTITRAQTVKDPRLAQLIQAQRESNIEACLRKMSIICEADILREFPGQGT